MYDSYVESEERTFERNEGVICVELVSEGETLGLYSVAAEMHVACGSEAMCRYIIQ